ncbi:MAG: hypothetical protein A2X94_07290 [Bdellovibrionales bacterium GWB1_55_8]|nr:MAG: hypothetical protein A2X94_07290 [Bdellovibrionales bacterium GWB1_55_8]
MALMFYEEALSLVSAAAARRLLPDERIPLEFAIGRRIRENVRSREPQPSFDNSAMDGFAVRSVECSDSSVILSVLESIAAGDRPMTLGSGTDSRECVEIMTGAPLPASFDGAPFDAVVKVEEVEVLEKSADGRPRLIKINRAVSSGENVRRAGEDFAAGALLCQQGTVIHSQHLLALGAAGAGEVLVRRRPRVAVISTGNELMEVSAAALPKGTIRNSSAPFLIAALRDAGAEASYLGIVRDSEPEKLESMVQKLVKDGVIDVVITTGAVSMGRHDFIPDVLSRLGGQPVFHKTATRPGKPILFSTLGEQGPLAWFGLPGNPVSTAVGFRFFVMPYLRALMGSFPELPVRRVLNQPAKKPEGLRTFLLSTLMAENRVDVIPAQASFKVSPLLRADSWVILPEEGRSVSEGESVAVLPFSALIES